MTSVMTKVTNCQFDGDDDDDDGDNDEDDGDDPAGGVQSRAY